MCGGDKGSVARAEQAVLQHMGKKVVHCGGPGTGGIAKVCNNLVLGVNMVGVAEAMNLGVRLGTCCSFDLLRSIGRSHILHLTPPTIHSPATRHRPPGAQRCPQRLLWPQLGDGTLQPLPRRRPYRPGLQRLRGCVHVDDAMAERGLGDKGSLTIQFQPCIFPTFIH